MTKSKIQNEIYMQRAIELARMAEGKTSPNPPVGCVIVRNNRIIGEGYHRKAGLPHAEIEALKRTKFAGGATMYVTLEPCDHYGKTPPCTNAIIERRIKKVIIGMKDPNPINNGMGIKKLKKNNIKIEMSKCQKEAARLYRPYIKFITKGMPFVTVKIAQSLDGKIATRIGESKWISNASSRDYVRKLRLKKDAVMVGINTVLKDDPLLLPKKIVPSHIKRIIVDSKLRVPLNSRIVDTAGLGKVLIATKDRVSVKKKQALTEKGIITLSIKSKNDKIDLEHLLRALAGMGIMDILVEGGGELVGKLFDEKLVDKIIFFLAPKIIGGKNAISSVQGKGIKNIKDAIKLKNIDIKRFDKDFLIEADVGK